MNSFLAEVPDRHDFYQPIAYPAPYIARTALLQTIKAGLLASMVDLTLITAAPAQRVANVPGLTGAGGIGKGVMAHALCDDEEICAAFWGSDLPGEFDDRPEADGPAFPDQAIGMI